MWPRRLRQRARLPVRSWLRGSLRRQLLILLVPALALMMAVDTWFTYGTLRDAANTAYDRSLYGSVLTIDNAIGMAGESIQLSLPDAAMEMFETAAQTHVFYRVSMERAGQIETVTGYDDLPLPTGALRNGQPRFYDATYRGDRVRIAAMARPVYRPDAHMRVIIQVAETAEPRAALIGNVWRSALLRDIALIIVSALILVGGITYVLRPLQQVRDDVRARSPEDLTPLEFDHVPVEVRPLVDAVNLHVSRSDAMAQAQAQFIADAAHQLRTPLAILKTQAEFAQRQLDTFGGEGAAHSGAAEAVGGIVKQLEQAARMTNQLLALARVRQHAPDGTAPATEVEIIDAIGVAEQVALDYLPLARGRQQDFGWERPAGLELPVQADPALLREAFANLVHNAIQYSGRRSRITLSATQVDDSAMLIVEDDGPGIPEAEREKVFARFYRRVGHTETGSGLGLAISREMATRCGGTVVLREGAQGRGVRAELSLPLVKPTA
ncbi:sensor histidine kinase [Cupriavidus metallidurans]|uniref:sensor histidine kinase n=1 Tax=Cupriavidus TaxID=106589 RepID=UPI000E9DFB85|nr:MULTISPECIES: sensor histidine kinase [Cupriavidus]GMG91822.1 two component sensor kinase [Cupriavidus sp. TKC]HBD35617.1 sensor histidine kinase [Cupriavidus sp.]HBO83011.1 sensor histidine kinase [Cupriavidus sp.]